MTEFEDRLDAAWPDGMGEAKRSRGRPRKDEQPEPPEIDVKVIGQAIEIPFDLWAAAQGVPELKITTAESVMLAKPVKQLLDHYVPQVPAIAWAWISLGAVSYSIMKCRLALIAEIKKARVLSSEQVAGGKDSTNRTNRRAQGGARSSVFPTVEQIKNPET